MTRFAETTGGLALFPTSLKEVDKMYEKIEREIAARYSLGYLPTEATPDHSSLTRIRQRLPFEAHEQVFLFVLQLAQQKKLLRGKTVAVDATTLEANAALKSIVRRDNGQSYNDYLKELAKAAGMENPIR